MRTRARNARCMLAALMARPPQADSSKDSNRDKKDNKDNKGNKDNKRGSTTRGPR